MSNNKSPKKGFSLIDLLMYIMIVGIVFTFVIPLREDRRNHQRLTEAIRDMREIAKANIAFKNDPDNGYYAFDLGMLNIEHKLAKNFFNYALSDTTITAVSTEKFGVQGAEIYYYLPNGPWMAKDDKLTRSVINPNWLP